ncbi:hypothetical protein OSB04_010060 [Centaurea solstitialis]|uniref:Uncharacterized protein n=1 Tax=Centaurea solstitialis TaxID=347529 RepID=A0AA38THM9_9ASTR|nr:hypothetical protein OSB04_010060 [Centaurea solstitialis]
MESCSYASISSIPSIISERMTIFHEEQQQQYSSELEFSDETSSIDHQNRPAFFKHNSFDNSWSKNNNNNSNSIGRKKKNQVFLEGYIEASDEDDLVRAKSLTDEDLDELKGCFDLGFGFSYDEIPELCNTLPALELCYSMSQKFLDEQQKSPEVVEEEELDEAASPAPAPAPIANWKISSPGDHPEAVKARLKYWAQAVACTVRLCN